MVPFSNRIVGEFYFIIYTRSFVSEDGRRMAVVVANQQTAVAKCLSARIEVPGFHLVDGDATGSGQVSGNKVRLNQFDLAVLLFERDS